MSKCTACGDKPENTAKDFTKAVVEINNPETLILLRKVVVPASMGDEEQVPPAIGKYNNVILYYEANKHVYLYSSDGIPTMVKTEIPQEIIDRIDTLEDDVEDLNDAIDDVEQGIGDLNDAIDDVEQEIEDLKNSPDVVDIVATYAELQAYDTSKLGDKDIIRVLSDTTHDGESTYYRWDKTNSQWIYIGSVGSYYTKSETDTLLGNKQDTLTAGTGISIDNNVISSSVQPGSIKVLTSADFNYDYGETGSYNSVALWLLPEGIYSVGSGEDRIYAIPYIPESLSDESFYHEIEYQYCYSVVPYEDNSMKLIMALNGIIDEDAKTSYMVNTNGSLAFKDHVMWQSQGLVLSQELERRIAKTTTAPTSSTVGSVGQLLEDTTNGKLYQCTAVDTTSTPAVYTWKEITPNGLQFKTLTAADVNFPVNNPSAVSLWRLPTGVYTSGSSSVTITMEDYTSGYYNPAYKLTPGKYAVVIHSLVNDSVDVYIHSHNEGVASGTVLSSTGSSSNKVIGPSKLAHDLNTTDEYAALGAQQGKFLDQKIEERVMTGSGAPTTSTVGTVGKLYEDTTNGKLYICTTVSGSTYTWEEVGTGGGSTITMTTTDPGEGSALAENNYVGVYGGDPIIMDYSTNEVNTGAKWIDGSTIYKKTLVISIPDSGESVNKDHGITNLNKYIKYEGVVLWANGTTMRGIPSTYVENGSLIGGYTITCQLGATSVASITLNYGQAFRGGTAYVTLYYTKSS